MAEYIKRDDALRTIATTTLSDIAFGLVLDIPAADVRSVVKACWIGEGDGYADGEMVYDVWHCSNCDYTVDEGDNEPPRYNFCPNCGADMGGEDDGL